MYQVIFVSLGGLEEIGLNCYLYGSKNHDLTNYIMIDLGIGFRDNRFTFLDTFIPDISLFKKKTNKLNAIFFTHGHEDHIGALEYHYDSLKNIPIYATPFTADLIRNKLKYYKVNSPKIKIVKFYKKYKVNDFTITFIPIEHSIPESAMILIEMHSTTILHSGDFRLNPDTFKSQYILEHISNKVDYLFCDSTNADKNIPYEAETIILPSLNNIIQKAKRSVWVTLFSSNIERFSNVIQVAKSHNKKVVLLGTSVNNYYNVANAHKYIVDNNNIITLEQAVKYPAEEILYIITGSQGENNSFLLQVLLQNYKGLSIKKDDIVVFLSKPIPGNELKVNKAYNLIISAGAKLYKHGENILHVSGHASAKQLECFINTIKPKCVIPIHGELLHLNKLSNIAKDLGVASCIITNGQMIDITKDYPRTIDCVPVDKLYFESGRSISLEDNLLKDRKKSIYEGVVFISLLVDKNKINKDIRLTTLGLLTNSEQNIILPRLVNEILKINKVLFDYEISNNEIIKTKVKSCVRKFFKCLLSKKPTIIVEVFYR